MQPDAVIWQHLFYPIGALFAFDARHYLRAKSDVHLGPCPYKIRFFSHRYLRWLIVEFRVVLMLDLSQRRMDLFLGLVAPKFLRRRGSRLSDRIKDRPLVRCIFLSPLHA